jgi:thiol-disulfide isomerase/thioredoxin
MTTRWWVAITLAAVVSGSHPPADLWAQSSTLLYPPSDAKRDIETAIQAASKDGKHVLLDFGADWCPDCRVLGTLLEDPAVAAFLAANFDVVHIDVGRRDKNGSVAEAYGATSGDWIPAVVILDAQARQIARTDDKVRLTRHTSSDQLLALLREWAPKKVVAELGAMTRSGVRVDLTLQEDRSHRSWLAATFIPQAADTHLYAKSLPENGVNGLGRPTRLSVVTASGIQLTGELIADRPEREDRLDTLNTILLVYPPGPVTLLVPVRITAPARAEVSLSYMACGAEGCRPPVQDARVVVTFPPAQR